MPEVKIGIIGGSGLYHLKGMTEIEEVKVSTPFGEPSDDIVLGNLEGIKVAFLPRHGKGHRIYPGGLPSRANIYALKSLGVERVISVGAVGSLKEGIKPLDLVVPDQLIDNTKGRDSTFFTNSIVAHVAFAEPFCPELSRILFKVATRAGATVHKGGIYVAIEGPQFSTRAESQIYRSWGADIIGMTVMPEAKLAREAEMCYTMLAVVTDYDCWHPRHQSVTTEMILASQKKGIATAREILRLAIPEIPKERSCDCSVALKNAIATSPAYIPDKAKADLALLIGKYLK